MESLICNYNVEIIKVINNESSLINFHTSKIYIINLKSDILRNRYITLLMKKLNINYYFVIVSAPNAKVVNKFNKLSYPELIVNKISTGEVGCYLSHMWCLKDIIDNNIKNAIIFEDDIVVHKDFERLYQNIVMKKEWDYLMLGAGDYGFNKGNSNLIKDNIYIPKFNFTLGTHAIYYSNYGAKTVYNYRLKNPNYFDKNLKCLFNYFSNDKTGIVVPNLFTVENSSSNLNHNFGITKYVKNDYYYNNCYNNFNFKDYFMIYLDLFKKFILEDYDDWKRLNLREIIIKLLKNYFNNNNYLVNLHLNKLNLDFFSTDDYLSLLNSSFNKIIFDYYKDYKYSLCNKFKFTSGQLLIKNITRDNNYNISNLFYKEYFKPELKYKNIEYEIKHQVPKRKNLVANLHCLNLDDFNKIYNDYFNKIYDNFDIIITYSFSSDFDINFNKMLKLCTILKCPNKGFDIGGKFITVNYLKKSNTDYEYILFLHNKSCKFTRDLYFNSLIGNLPMIKILIKNGKIGGFFPPTLHCGNNLEIIYNEKYLNYKKLEELLYISFSNNKLYVKELLNYFNISEKEITLWSSGNCYILNKNIAYILYSDKRIYNCLNQIHEQHDRQSVECFDYNWVKINYKLDFKDIDFVFEMAKKYNFKMNVLQDENNQFQLRDAMIEHAFERIIFQIIFNTKNKFNDYYEIEILPNKKRENQNHIKKICHEINLFYKNRVKYEDFNYENYIEKNKDLKGKIFCKEHAWNHWVKYGLVEGRKL